MKTPTMTNVKYLIIIPQSLQKQFLSIAYEASGHQGYAMTAPFQYYQTLPNG